MDPSQPLLLHETALFSAISVGNTKIAVEKESLASCTNHEKLVARLEKMEEGYPKGVLEMFRHLAQVRQRVLRCQHKLVLAQGLTNAERRVVHASGELGLSNIGLIRVKAGYYDRSLVERAVELGAVGIHSLCKSLLYKNTIRSDDAPKTSQVPEYFLIIVQYSHKLNEDKLAVLLNKQCGRARNMARKVVDLRFATDQESKEVTGYEHNAVAPIGLRKQKSVAIVVAEEIYRLCPLEIFLGGGEVNTKLRISNLYDFERKTGALRLPISERRV